MVNKPFCGRRYGAPKTCFPFHAKRSGADAGADRTRHPGAAKSAIAGRILGQILLMIVLGEIEFAGRCNLRGDGAEALCRQRLLIGRSRRCLLYTSDAADEEDSV